MTFNVIGNLARPTSSSSSNSSPGSSTNTDAVSGSGTDPASTLTNLVFKITYNPLLNTVTLQLVAT